MHLIFSCKAKFEIGSVTLINFSQSIHETVSRSFFLLFDESCDDTVEKFAIRDLSSDDRSQRQWDINSEKSMQELKINHRLPYSVQLAHRVRIMSSRLAAFLEAGLNWVEDLQCCFERLLRNQESLCIFAFILFLFFHFFMKLD